MATTPPSSTTNLSETISRRPPPKGSSRASIARFPIFEQQTILSLNPDYPNATTRKYLAHEWKKLSSEDQILLRAKRTKRGIKCDICGLAGYFRENCPKNCQSPPSTPSSTASTPRKTKGKKRLIETSQEKEKEDLPTLKETTEEKFDNESSLQSLGVFWGNQSSASLTSKDPKDKKSRRRRRPTERQSNDEPSFSLLKQKVDLSTARPDATQRLQELQQSDQDIGHFSYYHLAERNYARNHSELTLQQVMRRLIRLLQKQVDHNITELESSFDTTLLAPPANKIQKTFYPPALFQENKELRDYYVEKESQKKNDQLAYRHQGSLRPVDDLDVLFRGQSTNYKNMYSTKKNAGESIHAKNTWKSVLSKNDTLANSDPSLIKKQEKLNKLFDNQSKWIRLQSTDMKYRNDRFEHLVHIINQEIEKEHQQEGRLLLAGNKPLERNVALDLWQERLSSVDLMIKVLHAYNFTAGLEEADFLLFCLNEWQQEGKKHILKVKQKFYQQSSVISADSPQRTVASHDSAVTETVTSAMTNEDNNEENDDENDTDLHSNNSSKKKKKINQKASKFGGSNRRDLVAETTHPYYQDVQYLKYTKRKHEQFYQKSKTGTVFTAQGNREFLEKLRHKQEENLFALENTYPSKSVGETYELDHQQSFSSTISTTSSRRVSTVSPPGAAVGILEAANDRLALPSLEEITEQAMQHKNELNEIEERKAKQRELMNSSKPRHENLLIRRFRHPREIDAENIAKIETSFRRAGLGNRIRKGKDDDLAMVLPALIPIPKAFDGNSQTISHTGQNIILKLKKELVLSDIGYTPQHAVPLYVRNTLMEKEGTSMNGDPTQEELAKDRRYAHYVGRPLVRFNPPEAVKELQDSLAVSDQASSATNSLDANKLKSETSTKFLKNDLSALNESFEQSRRLPLGGTSNNLQSSTTMQEERKVRREIKALKEEAKEKNLPMTNSLVRLVFKKTPNLEDLKYLSDEF